ncbi:HNH endonuclease [Desertihabitans brevis]|uniref:HNH endonuclease n=1 Tax=Desertihabitans brevis TaxID=2268447 RepID=A0A367Z045_9ACTN|nr:HNH endonuclease signature motif containing protein [Desertihabitans brevis]RCK71526.1 HNH endonuclease [Desertihabitans brevis]
MARTSDRALDRQDDGELVDLLRHLEELKCAAEALQGRAALALDRSVRAEEQRRGLPEERQGRGVAAQVALARRESPARGRHHLGLAKVLPAELPHTTEAFRRGRISEWRATLVARETGGLSREDRERVDAELAADPDRLESMGDRELVATAQRLSYRLDPQSAVVRRRRGESERRVSLRPAPDLMSQLSALLPVKDGVAVVATLSREADSLIATGDGRGRGQIMADTLVDRVLGRTPLAWSQPTTPAASAQDRGTLEPGPDVGVDDVDVLLHVVVTDDVLLGTASGSAHLDGYGPIPGDLARELVGERTWVRRLYVRPGAGHLVAADSRARRFPRRLAQLVRLRDQRCRTPWCDAPIRTTDHIRAVADGGPTSLSNGQGLCEACNYAKEAPGFTARARPGPRHTTQTTTPTGHRYVSVAPPLLEGTDASAPPARSP